ncbi:alpha-L-fucosidase [Vararia minispora EC-137]|uniref:Alpha-L-fucosidase n=1 Tax=Vararia minispora EC-137 TaxID=1314806 RepID=A0ACB8Q7R7_9AGAM|nr:alpha-L-fucosidase [Vararia minispora EC-137]
MATYQDLEWGDDKQPTELFNPTNLDTDQWADAAVEAQMKAAFLTTKHHDGFCLWPTKTGTPSVLHTPNQVDIVSAYTKSFRKRGLKIGLYYSILDKRNDIRHFNVTPEKIRLVKSHITELLTNYGEIFMIIFDGWAAPWSRIPYSEFPFEEIYLHVKSLQPDCLVTDLNASDFHPGGLFYGDIKAFEQNAGQAIPLDNTIPAFSCVTLTDGWFWKQSDIRAELKSTYRVVHDWLIPQNTAHCTLIVNAPPNREGRLAPNVVKRLHEIGRAWTHPGPAATLTKYMAPVTTKNLAQGVMIHCSGHADGSGPDQANDGNLWSTWYSPHKDKEGWLELVFPEQTTFNRVLSVEPIGRWADYPRTRIGGYKWQALVGEKWITLVDVPYESGSSHPCVLTHWVKRTISTRVRFWFEVVEDTAHVNLLGVYDEPERV